jgi:hypothetical protein
MDKTLRTEGVVKERKQGIYNGLSLLIAVLLTVIVLLGGCRTLTVKEGVVGALDNFTMPVVAYEDRPLQAMFLVSSK